MKIWNPLLWLQMFRYYWVVSRGHRLSPWRSRYLRWRAETIWGIPAEELNAGKMATLFCRDFRAVIRFAGWTREMRHYLKSR